MITIWHNYHVIAKMITINQLFINNNIFANIFPNIKAKKLYYHNFQTKYLLYCWKTTIHLDFFKTKEIQ